MNVAAILVGSAAAALAVAITGFSMSQDHAKPAMHKIVGTNPGHVGRGTPLRAEDGHELAAFSGGCFWGTEETFRNVRGVKATAVGYTGGQTSGPTYETVCSHTTGHAETVLIEYDPKVVTYNQLLDRFWDTHDGTQLNRQGPDYGDSYRSAIWTFSPEQVKAAELSKALRQKKTVGQIVTTIKPLPKFWIAEYYHQQYDEKTGYAGCPLLKTGG